MEGKVSYFTCLKEQGGGDNSSGIMVGLIGKDPDKKNNWTLLSPTELPAMTLNTKGALLSIDGQTNSGTLREIKITDNDTTGQVKFIDCSNWQGDSNGNNGGYLDYDLSTAGKGYDENQGVYVYFPEGLNTRDKDQRKDIRSSKMTIGYYAEPVYGTNSTTTSSPSPLGATSYNIEDRTAFCKDTRSQRLHLMLFDRYGRKATSDAIKDEDKAHSYWDAYNSLSHNPFPNRTVTVCNQYPYPIIIYAAQDGKSSSQLGGLSSGGVFVPGNGVFYQLMTASSSLVTPDAGRGDIVYNVGGRRITTPLINEGRLFRNTLQFSGRGFAWSDNFTIQTNVGSGGGKWMELSPSYDAQYFSSMNTFHLWNVFQHTAILDWGIIYTDPRTAALYSYYYNLGRCTYVPIVNNNHACYNGQFMRADFKGDTFSNLQTNYQFKSEAPWGQGKPSAPLGN